MGPIVKLKACSLSAGELVLQLIMFMALYKITSWIFYDNDVTLGKRSKCICTLLILYVCEREFRSPVEHWWFIQEMSNEPK